MSEESTTPDLVELVRKQLEALDRGDLYGVMSSVAEDVVLDGRADLVEGRAAIRGFLDEWFNAYEELKYEVEEVSHLGGGVVFAVVIQDGRLVGSDGHIRQREGWVYLFAGGAITRLTTSEVDDARPAAERLAEERKSATSQENVEVTALCTRMCAATGRLRRWGGGGFLASRATHALRLTPVER